MNQSAYKIIVTSGSQSGEEFVISKRVTRVGSDSGCEIRINSSDIPGHALSIDVGGPEVIVYNRTDSSITLSGEAVASGASKTWMFGQEVSLGNGDQLCLQAYSFQAAEPIRRPELEPPPEDTKTATPYAPKEPNATKESSGKSNLGQIAFIIACLLLVVLMIIKKVSNNSKGPVSGDATAMTWERVWIEMNNEPRVKDDRYVDLRRELQKLYRLRNNPESLETPRCKSRVLQMLITSESDQTLDRAMVQQLREFVNDL